MKILFFSYAYPNVCNPGLGTFNKTMIAGLSNEHEVRVVSPVSFIDVWKATARGRLRRGLNDSTFAAVPNVPAEYCPWYYTPKILRQQYGRFMRRSVAFTLNRVMDEFQPNLVLSYWTHPDGEVAVEAAHRFGIRAVTMVGGSDVLINARDGARRTSILNVLHSADGVVTVSEDLKKVLISDGIPADKLHVARRGVDRRLFHAGDRHDARQKLGLPDDRPIVINVGRLVDVKGHVHLIEACRLLAQRGIQLRCYLLGDGPLRTKLEKQIAQAGLTHVVELRGSQTPERLAEWYRAGDLSVLASLSEGVPNVLLESIASGIPFVASRVGGIPEIADPSLDTLVPASNPVALANALADHLAKAGESRAYKRRFEVPTIDESAKTLSAFLKLVASGERSPLAEVAIMHETKAAADSKSLDCLAGAGLATDTVKSVCPSTSKQLVRDDWSNDDFCDRTGEGFFYHPES